MTKRIFLRAVIPIGMAYSGSLVCSNMVYLYLSVPFIQMLKAAAPVAVLFTSWAWRVKEPSWSSFINICVIVTGVVLASLGEIEFQLLGFVFQMAAIVFESVKLVMIEVLLKGEGEMQQKPSGQSVLLRASMWGDESACGCHDGDRNVQDVRCVERGSAHVVAQRSHRPHAEHLQRVSGGRPSIISR